MHRAILTSVLAAAAAVAGLSGCGVATAPVSVAAAVASNANYNFKGTVVDQAGMPLDGVLMAKEWHHLFWTPVRGGKSTDEHSLQRVDRSFSVAERGTDMEIKFTKDGYHDARFNFRAPDNDTVFTPDGDWPNTENFPVVLYARNKPDDRLKKWSGAIDYIQYPTTNVIELDRLGDNSMFRTLEATNASRSKPGTLYLTLTKEAPPTINAKGDVDPADANLPGRITLHITGAENGFVRITPRVGYHPIRSSEVAPTLGYVPELTIDRKRLQQMRRAPISRIIEAHEYFYFRANGHYGKGSIRWLQSVDKDIKATPPVAFQYSLWLQPNENDPNIITRAPMR
jgi:hypothetical protein